MDECPPTSPINCNGCPAVYATPTDQPDHHGKLLLLCKKFVTKANKCYVRTGTGPVRTGTGPVWTGTGPVRTGTGPVSCHKKRI